MSMNDDQSCAIRLVNESQKLLYVFLQALKGWHVQNTSAGVFDSFLELGGFMNLGAVQTDHLNRFHQHAQGPATVVLLFKPILKALPL